MDMSRESSICHSLGYPLGDLTSIDDRMKGFRAVLPLSEFHAPGVQLPVVIL